MSDPIFVRTRHTYDSYNDLWRLVELSDFPTCYVDEIDAASDQTYILPTRNGECGDGWAGARAHIIHWNLEWEMYPDLPGISEVWHSDQWFGGAHGLRYVPMGSHSGLKLEADYPADVPYHAAFLGYMIPRRQQVWTWLKERGLRITTNGAWNGERHALLMQSALYLHVHAAAALGRSRRVFDAVHYRDGRQSRHFRTHAFHAVRLHVSPRLRAPVGL